MPDSNAEFEEVVDELKRKIPVADHGALESRMEQLLNDPSADRDDVISILRKEFDPEHED